MVALPCALNQARRAGKEPEDHKGHREVLSIGVSLMSVVLALPSSRRGQKRKPCTKKDAPAEQHGNWRKIFYKLQADTQS